MILKYLRSKFCSQTDTLKLPGKIQTKTKFLFKRIKEELNFISQRTRSCDIAHITSEIYEYLLQLEEEIKST